MRQQYLKPSAVGVATTRCSALDAMLVMAYPMFTICYPERIDPERLRESLLRVLGDFGAYSGRLRRSGTDLFIDHGRGGALFELAESSQTSAELCSALRTRHSRLSCPNIAPLRAARGKEPLLAVRLTHTPDGCALGVTWSHAVGDFYSMMLLVRAWSAAYRGQSYEKPLEVGERDLFLDEHLPRWQGEPGWQLLSWFELARNFYRLARVGFPRRRVTLELSGADVAAIHASALRGGQVTINDAITAHLAALLYRAGGGSVSPNFATAIEYRKRLGLPARLLGNLSDLVTVTGDPGDDASTLARALRRSVNAFGKGPFMQRELLQLVAAHPRFSERMRYWRTSTDPHRVNLNFTNIAGSQDAQPSFEAAPPSTWHWRATDLMAPGLACVFDAPGGGQLVDAVLPVRVARALSEIPYRAPLPVPTNGTRQVLAPGAGAPADLQPGP